jgi:hypothetical protein
MESKEVTLPPIELGKFELLCQELFQQKAKLDGIRELEKEECTELEKLKTKIMAYMDQYGKEKHSVTGLGTLSVQEKFYASMPKDPEKKAKFFEFLKARGLFEGMLSVHAATMNTFVAREIEAAKESGNFDFQIPGVDDFGNYKILSIRKK